MRRFVIAFGAALALALACRGHAWAANCSTFSVSALTFPSYDVFSGSDTVTTASITLVCTGNASVVISISQGGALSYSPRQAKFGTTDKLNYNLYKDAAYSQIWGDGTGTTQTSTVAPANGISTNATIYGKIPAGQDITVGGPYSDSVTVTINY